jgi:hypothetical protein
MREYIQPLVLFKDQQRVARALAEVQELLGGSGGAGREGGERGRGGGAGDQSGPDGELLGGATVAEPAADAPGGSAASEAPV